MDRMKTLMLAMVPFIICACSSGGGGNEPDEPVTPPTQKQINIKLSTSVQASSGAETTTRVTDNAFEQNDKVGVFVVNRKADGSAATLAVSGNHVDNMRFTYNGTWNPDTPIYWSDNKTHADFYLYHPYTAGLTTVTAVPFSVQADQSTEAAYKKSDVLTGTAENVAPTEQTVMINARHVMSKALIIVEAGNGFTAESLAKSNISVKLNNIRTQSTLNIATGDVTATGNAATLTPLKTNDGYVALLPPQTVTEGNLITINIDGKDYNLKKGFTFKGRTRHKFTVTVSKVSSGVNVEISKWEDDGTDNGGTAE